MANIFPGTDVGDQAWRAFRRDLPALLGNHRGQWVAYRGEQQLGTGLTPASLYDEWLSRGIAPEDLVICQVEPIVEETMMGMGEVIEKDER
jgi:hypothetical protein